MDRDKHLLYTRENLRSAIARVATDDAEIVYSRDDLREAAAELGLSPDRVEAAAFVARTTDRVPDSAPEGRGRRISKVGFGLSLVLFLVSFGWSFFALAPPFFVYLKFAAMFGVVGSLLGIALLEST